MKRFFYAAAFVLAASLPACQCDSPPPVGPAETSAVAVVSAPLA